MDPCSTEIARITAAYEQRKHTVPRTRYSWLNAGNLLSFQELERGFLAVLDRENLPPLSEKLILEVGCGNGFWLREFIKWGALPENLNGIDLLLERVEEARKLCPRGVHLQCGNAARLAFADDAFDLVLQSTAFTSILESRVKRAVAAEMLRVLKPKAFIPLVRLSRE